MIKYIAYRILQAIPTLFIIITLSFFLLRFAPGSPFSGERVLPPEVMANIEAKYGFDQPLYKQYMDYLIRLAHGDFGPSFVYKDQTVNDLVDEAFPVSVKLGTISFIIATFIGLSLGIWSALRQNTWVDYTVTTVSMLGAVVPTVVLGPALIYLFTVYLRVLPGGGWDGGDFPHLVMPVIALSVGYVSMTARVMRGSMLEVMGSNFIRTARAKGIPFRHIVWRHALRPAILPVVAFLGMAFVFIITGALVVENIYLIPGMGQIFVTSSTNRDYSMVMGLTIIVAVLVIIFNVIIDIIYAFLDPRIRY